MLIASGIISVIFALLIFFVVGVYIQDHYAYLDQPDGAAIADYLYQGSFSPENVERLQYIAALVIIPLAILAGNLVLLYVLKKRPQAARRLCRASLAFCAISIPLLVSIGFSADSFFITESSIFKTVGPLAVLLAALVIPAIYLYEKKGDRIKGFIRRWSGPAYWVGALAMILPVSVLFLTDKYGIEGKMPSEHLNALLYSVTQVQGGKAMLVDLTSQYGLYAQFLQPIFHVIGLDIFRFFLVMSAMTGLSFLFLAIFVFGTAKNRLIALTGFATIIYCNYIFIKQISPDPYYQYLPLRLIFPALFILSSWLYFRTGKRWLYYGNFTLASVSVLWNLDTGIVVMGAWLLTLAYDEWVSSGLGKAAKKTLKHLLYGILVLAIVVAIYSAYVYLIRGALPDYGMAGRYQFIFYGLGYYMIKMTLLHPWNMVGLVYVAGITYAVLAKLSGKADIKARLIFLLTILGAGIFSYYQGRSHDYNLTQVWYPAILILILFGDMLYEKIIAPPSSPSRQDRAIALPGACVFIVIILLFACSTLSLVLSYGPMVDTISSHVRDMQDRPQGSMEVKLSFIQENTRPGEEVYIFSYDQAFYYAESGTCSPIKVPSEQEIMSRDDIAVLCDYLSNESNQVKIFLDSSCDLDPQEVLALAYGYKITGTSPSYLMSMYEPWKKNI